jgi:uncharacterized protein (TIGR00251 family)
VIALHETSSGITFAIKVQPRARRNAIVGELGKALKLALIAAPVDGRANQACVEFFADLFDVSRSSITIVSGQSSRNKVIRITGSTLEHLRSRIKL